MFMHTSLFHAVMFSVSIVAHSSVVQSHTTFLVHSVQQKSSGLIFRTSCSGTDMTYSCHHNWSHFTFPIFVLSWRFSVFHSLQSVTQRIYWPKTPIHLLNLKLKHELKVINFPRCVACKLCFHGWMLRKGSCLPHQEVAARINAWWQYSSETNYIGSSPVYAEKASKKVVFECKCFKRSERV